MNVINKEPMQKSNVVPSKKLSSYFSPDYEEFAITYHRNDSGVYNIYLYGVIESAQQFVGAVEALSGANESDVVVIHLSTDGGSLDATDTLLAAMEDTDAHVIVKATGSVNSAGTLLMLAADEFTLTANTSFLIHNGSCGSGGKYSDFIAHTEHTKKYFERVMRNAYKDFLTDDEIENVLKGVDMWMDSDEWIRRHENRNEISKVKMEALKEEYLKSLEDAKSTPPKSAKKSKPALA